MTDVQYQVFGSLLHPSDFSEASGLAFDHALRIALCNQCYFDILHVRSDKSDGAEWPGFPQVRRTLEHWNLLEEGSSQKAVGDQLGVRLRKVELRNKRPLPAIIGFLEEERADLVVLSTQGRTGLPRWLQPSISEPLSRMARIPTLFIPEGVRGFVSRENGEVHLEHVLIPIDQKPNPQIAIESGGAFLRSIDVKAPRVDALFVGDPDHTPEVEQPSDIEGPFERIVRHGDPVDEILNAANEQRTDLIVMATEGRNGFLDALRGSTTEQVLRQSSCPVLAIPVSGV
jgi:nucleotide-binding universal stress UspA family protein